MRPSQASLHGVGYKENTLEGWHRALWMDGEANLAAPSLLARHIATCFLHEEVASWLCQSFPRRRTEQVRSQRQFPRGTGWVGCRGWRPESAFPQTHPGVPFIELCSPTPPEAGGGSVLTHRDTLRNKDPDPQSHGHTERHTCTGRCQGCKHSRPATRSLLLTPRELCERSYSHVSSPGGSCSPNLFVSLPAPPG